MLCAMSRYATLSGVKPEPKDHRVMPIPAEPAHMTASVSAANVRVRAVGVTVLVWIASAGRDSHVQEHATFALNQKRAALPALVRFPWHRWSLARYLERRPRHQPYAIIPS